MTGDEKSNQVNPAKVSEALSRDVIIRGYRELVERQEALVRQQQAVIEQLAQLLTLLLAPRLVPDGATFYPAGGAGVPVKGKS